MMLYMKASYRCIMDDLDGERTKLWFGTNDQRMMRNVQIQEMMSDALLIPKQVVLQASLDLFTTPCWCLLIWPVITL